MAAMKLTGLLCVLAVIAAVHTASATRLGKDLPRAHLLTSSTRHLLDQWTNNVRAASTTAAAIQAAVDRGGDLYAIQRAGHIGNQMAAAAAQPNQHVFDAVDKDHSDPWAHWGRWDKRLRSLL